MKPKVGDTIKIIRMDDSNGKDLAAQKMNGVVATISHIDSIGQIHLKGYTNEFQIPSEVDRKYSDNEEYIFEFDSELC